MSNVILDTVVVTFCPFCGKANEIEVNEMDYLDWKDGKSVQDAFPYLSADKREMLFSGICPTCWDGMFGGSADDDYEDEDFDDDNDLTEMEKLINLLETYHIPHEVLPDAIDGDPQVWYPSRDDNICDVICHKYSYGYDEGLLEMMGLVDEEAVGDNVEGYLTAEEVFGRIHANYFGTI